MTEIIISTPITSVSVNQDNIDVTVDNSEVTTSIIGIPGGLNVLGNQTWQDGALIYFDSNLAQFNQDAAHIKWNKVDKKLVISGDAVSYTVDVPQNFNVSLNYGTGNYYDYTYYNFDFKLIAYRDTSLGRVYSTPTVFSITTGAIYQPFNFSLSWDFVNDATGYIVLVSDPYLGYTSGDYGFDAGNYNVATYDYYNPYPSYFGANLTPTALSGIADPMEMITGGIQYGSGVDLNNNDLNFITIGAANKTIIGWDHSSEVIKVTSMSGGVRTLRANLNADNAYAGYLSGNFYGNNYGANYGAVYLGVANRLAITNSYGQLNAAPYIQIQTTYGTIEQKAGNSSRYLNVHGVLYDNYTSVSNSGTAETDLASHSLAANMFNYDGQKALFEVSGISANNANNKTLKIYFGTSVIYNSGALTNSAAGSWTLQGRIVRKNSTTIAYRVSLQTAGMSKAQDVAVGEISSGFSFAVAITLKMTGQGAASSDITQKLSTFNFEQVA